MKSRGSQVAWKHQRLRSSTCSDQPRSLFLGLWFWDHSSEVLVILYHPSSDDDAVAAVAAVFATRCCCYNSHKIEVPQNAALPLVEVPTASCPWLSVTTAARRQA